MQYPLISEYIEAIRSAEDNFDKLSNLRPVFDDNGNPIMSSGNFAVVFKMKDENTGKLYAVKCFTRDQEHRNENYQKIAEELEFVSSPYFVHFRFMEKELFVDTTQSDEEEFPVLMMDWVAGQPLGVYLREHLSDDYERQMLAYRFCRMGAWLLSQPFAHGDLKPDNILVRNDGTLVLVDYDGMYVPSMKGQKAQELGSPDYRHPLRTEDDFDEHIDDFAIASIALSLKAISLDTNLYNKYGAADRLLFSAKDNTDLSKSHVMSNLLTLTYNAEIKQLLSIFLLVSATSNLGAISFRVLLLEEPEKLEGKNIRIENSENGLKHTIKDRFGVIYSDDCKTLIKAPDYLKWYKVKKGTKKIEKEAFSCCYDLQEIEIPDSIICIEDRAFECCDKLQKIDIPNSVTYIGNYAFYNCCGLRKINIPNSVTKIEDGTFSWCDTLQEIKIPNSITSIGNKAFYLCSSLHEINIPCSVITIGSSAFGQCESLQIINIPDSVRVFGNFAFGYCISLKRIIIPKGSSEKFKKMLPNYVELLVEE